MASIKTGFGKYLWIIGVVALFGTGGLFAYLESLGMDVVCSDAVCEVDTLCIISCNVTNPTSKSVYIYNYDDWKVTFSPDVVDVDIYVKYYGKWRYTNFTKETRFPNIPEDKKYVFVFSRYSKKEFELRTVASQPLRVKFDFGTLDPLIVAYEYKYENLSKEVPIYKDNLIEVKEYCFTNLTIASLQCNPAYSYITTSLIGYKTEYYDGKRIGVIVGGETYLGSVNIKDDNLIKWEIPIGDRNFELYGTCRDYEKEKGLCKEINLLK